ncbi:class I SAM-dependent methyltransferase [Anaerolentibacter hominis]|uniref:SAM-dependent methyltransferase n=1 Tax=Anaerolentibacter hominis TaxID=3079009 RepID=UPI0031B847E2
MEEQVKVKLAESLTSEDLEIIPYLPYLLQDFWELGSSPEEMMLFFKKYIPTGGDTKVLDLACGKGAVSVRLAKELGIKVKGIDILPEFISYAEGKAREYGVSHLCEFAVEDVNLSIDRERGYDCVIFGAVGDILGDYRQTLAKLLPAIKTGGFLLIDDAYVSDEAVNSRLQFEKTYPSYNEWCKYFEESGLRLVECKDDMNISSDVADKEMNWITSRANELINKYPAQKDMLERYVISQQAEYNDLRSDLIGAVWLLQKR